MGYDPSQQALAAVFVAGLVFIALSVTPARKYIINSIPRSMKLGVGAGIGLFQFAIIGLRMQVWLLTTRNVSWLR